MDMFSCQKRSEIMSHIRSKNTKSEVLVFRYLRRHKIYFQKHYSRAPGKPDLAQPRKKKAVFIDGDYWHGRTLERLRSTRSRDDYWVVKISKNVERDASQRNELRSLGWKVLEIWESDLGRRSKKVREETLEKIREFLK